MRTILLLASNIGCVILGYIAGQQSHQNVNDLIAVGFKVTDPEGHECRQFEEGLFTNF